MSSALVVTTMIAFVVPSATALPPSTRPVNISPALTVECRRDDGTVVEGLFPGGTKQKGCEFCHCDGHGQVRCAYMDCAAPRCVDPQRGECCSTCPNGPNCMTKSGQIVGEGEEVVEPDGRVCFCSMNNPQAVCSEPPRTTAPPSVCDTMEDGTRLAVGKEWRSPNGCKGCRCDSAGGKAVCWVQDCAPVPCANPVSTPGVCCPTCPNGKVISVITVRVR